MVALAIVYFVPAPENWLTPSFRNWELMDLVDVVVHVRVNGSPSVGLAVLAVRVGVGRGSSVERTNTIIVITSLI